MDTAERVCHVVQSVLFAEEKQEINGFGVQKRWVQHYWQSDRFPVPDPDGTNDGVCHIPVGNGIVPVHQTDVHVGVE
jgi:hypothetical protein